jgi:serine protease inhibitor
MNKKIILGFIIFILLSGVVLAARLFVFPYNPNQPPQADDSGSTEEGIKSVIEANNNFAFDAYKKIIESEEGNIFYSPYSISSALAMTYEGAEGETAEEIKSVFHFPNKNSLRPNFAAVYNNINAKDKNYELSTGNALWIQHDFSLLNKYSNNIENYYGGKAALLDFVNELEQSRQTINSFIEEQTRDKIKDLIPEGLLNQDTRLVLTNAIYFKGLWKVEFDKSDTREENFNISPSETIKVPMMKMKPEEEKFNYARTEELEILELSYKDEKISMLILLPNESLEDVESDLTLEKINEYKSQMRETELSSISIPKFEFDTKYFMNETLASLGMPTAFSSNADFSGITGRKDLFISSVIHQAYIGVDEKGTEAAAATAVVMELAMAPTNNFKADHPFVFIIQDKETGNILFMGRVVNPSN